MDGLARPPFDLMLRWDGGVEKRLRKYASPRVDSDRCVNCGSCLECDGAEQGIRRARRQPGGGLQGFRRVRNGEGGYA